MYLLYNNYNKHKHKYKYKYKYKHNMSWKPKYSIGDIVCWNAYSKLIVVEVNIDEKGGTYKFEDNTTTPITHGSMWGPTIDEEAKIIYKISKK